MNENCAALPQNGDALRAGIRAEEAHRRISEHEDRCFKQGQETKAAVDDLHRRARALASRVRGRWWLGWLWCLSSAQAPLRIPARVSPSST